MELYLLFETHIATVVYDLACNTLTIGVSKWVGIINNIDEAHCYKPSVSDPFWLFKRYGIPTEGKGEKRIVITPSELTRSRDTRFVYFSFSAISLSAGISRKSPLETLATRLPHASLPSFNMTTGAPLTAALVNISKKSRPGSLFYAQSHTLCRVSDFFAKLH